MLHKWSLWVCFGALWGGTALMSGAYGVIIGITTGYWAILTTMLTILAVGGVLTLAGIIGVGLIVAGVRRLDERADRRDAVEPRPVTRVIDVTSVDDVDVGREYVRSA